MQGFCEAMGFEEAAAGYNPNNGHRLQLYSDTFKLSTGEFKKLPELPKLKLPEPSKVSKDIDAMVAAIRQALGE